MLYKKNLYLVFALSLCVLCFVAALSLTKNHPAPPLLACLSLVFFGLFIYEYLKPDEKTKVQQAHAHTDALTDELTKLQTLLDNKMISQEEFEEKRDKLKIDYASQVNTYMNF